MADTTTNFKFKLQALDTIPWIDGDHDNWHVVDALLARYIAISSIQGAWANATAVTVGQRYIDTADDTIWEALVAHTTPSTGTFAESRTAVSTNWQTITVDASFKGAWAVDTDYVVNDFISDSQRYGVVVVAHTSATSYDAGVAAGNIVTLIDGSLIITSTSASGVAEGGSPTATYTASSGLMAFGIPVGATGATGAAGADYTANTQLNDISSLALTDGGFIVGDGSNFVLETGATAFSSIKQAATDSATGVVELATVAEATTGTDTERAITAAGLHGALAGLTDATIAVGDTLIFADADDGDALKEDTVQGLLDLASGGAWTLLLSATASTDTSIDFESNIDSTYDHYVFTITGGVPTAAGTDLQMLLSDDGGSTYKAGTGYEYHTTDLLSSSATYAAHVSTGTGQFLLLQAPQSSSTQPYNCIVHMWRPDHVEDVFIQWHGTYWTSGSALALGIGSGVYNASNLVVDAVRFQNSANGIDSGEFRMYGVKNS